MVTKDDINRIRHASLRQLLNDLPNEFSKTAMDIESFELTMSKGRKPDIEVAHLGNDLDSDWDGTIKVSIVVNLIRSSL